MSRPQTEAEYLARFPSAPVSGFSRRTLLGGALALGALGLSACTSGGTSTIPGAAASGEITFGNNQADPVPKAAIEAVAKAFQDANAGLTVKMNTVAHTTFQENINNYLQGSPDDAFGWFAGYRARFFASKNLVGDLSDVYNGIQGIPEGLKKACSTEDGKQIVIPATYYPWVVLYRKSVWEENGYTVPKTIDEFKALGDKMKGKGLAPLAFADKDGWEAMGTFDILNLRVNGYDYHINLMAGKEDWTSDKVAKVFDLWKGLLPYHQTDALGRSWQEAAQALQKGQAGMYYLGTFAAQQFAKGAEQDDLDFFVFPEVDSTIGTGAIEAPTDGYMMSRRPKNEAGAKKWLGYLGTADAQNILVQADPSVIATSQGADVTKYTDLQNKMLAVLKDAKEVALFLDRDSRPDFASTVMGPAIQSFIKNPDDITSILKNVEAQKKSIFAS
ncbi:carbohydrate ABC transporter substrate-binding protein [Propioniciclava sinopodophylli]|uniref:Carbohydrate ABC transporter substrate-binding protein n=1 Tax=Propioniciclava sinopodophylli TaxID=1837344 RepID=A0A4Q9KDU1_9ACTN|nr:ABC transporter substrate-binding protein [Propioniciclava sinopodophylli]TBT85046.1 carbohydrate ABC transporter substrate-binding protein [Propioniciclava sinopodophylli]